MLFAHIYFGSAAKGLTNALAGGQISTRRCRRRRLVGCVICGILGRSGRCEGKGKGQRGNECGMRADQCYGHVQLSS